MGFLGFWRLDVLEGVLEDWHELYCDTLQGLPFGFENTSIAHQSLFLVLFIFLSHVVAFDDHIHVGVLTSEKENTAVGIKHGAHFIFDFLLVFRID